MPEVRNDEGDRYAMKVDSMLRSAYSQLRQREIATATPTSALLSLAARKGVEMIRGNLMGRLYLRRQTRHFRGRAVQVRSPLKLSVGQSVVIDDYVRIDAHSSQGITLGDRVTVGRFAMISGSGVVAEPGVGITVGSNTAIGTRNIIWGQGGVVIGSNCLFGPGVTIISENHRYSDAEQLIRSQGSVRAPITIGDDCWLGSNVTVLAGVSVGKGCVIAAGSIVTKDIESDSIVAGVPARVIGQR